LAYLATILALFLPPLLAWGWEPTWAPYQYQLSRQAESGWTLYGVVMPSSWADSTIPARLFRLGSVVVVALALLWQRPDDLAGLLRRVAVILVVFVALQVFYSPQWLIWFSPLLVPLARIQPGVKWLSVALDLLTYLSFPVVYDLPGDPDSPDILMRDALRIGLIYGRIAILALLAGMLLDKEFRGQPGPEPVVVA
jgi:hypothetical protein